MDQEKIKQAFEAVFTEWDRRYRENPEQFMSEVEHLLGNTAASYGEGCAVYFMKLLNELPTAWPWDAAGAARPAPATT